MKSLPLFLKETPIVVVDDDPEARAVIKALLKAASLPNQVLECQNPVDAWLLLDDLQARGAVLPRLLFSDVNMPKQDGFSFVQKLRSESRFKSIAIVLMSSGFRTQDRSQACRCGADIFLDKYPGLSLLRTACLRILSSRVELVIGENQLNETAPHCW